MRLSNDLLLAFKLLLGPKKRFDLPVTLSIIGMAIGVASLITAMAVISGYESTLKSTVTNFVGHIIVINKEVDPEKQKTLKVEVEKEFPEILASTPFSLVDAAIVHNKKLNGVIVNGLEEKSYSHVLSLEKNIIAGKIDLTKDEKGRAKTVIGKELARKFNLKPGDVYRLVLPASNEADVAQLRPRLASFVVSAVIDIGRHDFDSRYIFMDINRLQEFAEVGDRVTGFRLKINDENKAESLSFSLNRKFGESLRARSWIDVNYSLFEAAKIEKAIIFFVLLIIVFAAATNVSGSLFIMVFKRYSDIAILKALGYSGDRVKNLFSIQGMLVGSIGIALGVVVGVLFCSLLLWAQTEFNLVSGEVYKLDHIDLEIRFLDLLLVVLSSFLICFLATIMPAARAAKLQPTEGLRYE